MTTLHNGHRPKIVVLDGYTLNPGDLNWDGLRELGDCVIYERTPPDLVIELAKDARIILTNKVVLDKEVLSALPVLEYIGVLATGYNVVDIPVAKERGITVTNVPAYSTRSVAQMVFALLLELTNHVGHHSLAVRDGRWTDSKDFTFRDHPLVELDGMTMGIVGFGGIGKAVADLGGGFGMNVVVHTRHPDPKGEPSVRFVDLHTLFAVSDVVTLHCPLTPDTRGLVNSARISLMKDSAFLINTSRGPVVDDHALAQALNDGKIAGAALDGLTTEPPPADNPLLTARNCVITPHIAWATLAARGRLMDTVGGNVRAYLNGRPINVVS